MSLFTGEYQCKIDAKGRLVLPFKIKANLPVSSENELVIRRGFEPCLVLYPLVSFKRIFYRVAGLNEFNEEYRRLQRNFFRGNTETELDKQGRFLIPKPMLTFAKLEREAIIVGMGNRVEIWNPDLYEEYLIHDSTELSKLAEKYLADEDSH